MWCPSLISQQLFALVVVPHSWVPHTYSTAGVFLLTSCPQPTSLRCTVVRTTLHSHPGHLPWQDFPSPRFYCVAAASPSLNLCHCPSLWDLHGGTAFSCGDEWSRKSQQPLLFQGNYWPTPACVEESGWGCPCRKLLGKGDNWHTGAVQQVSMAQGSYLISYKGYSHLTVPKEFSGQGTDAVLSTLNCSQLPLTDQNTTSQPAKIKMPHWGAVEMP